MATKKKMTSGLSLLLLFALLLSLAAPCAMALPGEGVRCTVTSAKARLYGEMNVGVPLSYFYAQGAKFVAYETQDPAWLALTTPIKGVEQRCYVSVLDLALAYEGEEEGEQIPIGLAEGGILPPDEVGDPNGLLDGVESRFKAAQGEIGIYEKPDEKAKRIGVFPQGTSFTGVLMEDGAWIKTLFASGGEEKIGYVRMGRSEGESRTKELTIVRITSGVITVYAKPSKSSQALGVVRAPVRFEGELTKSGNWLRVELAGKDTPRYGYIEARWAEKK